MQGYLKLQDIEEELYEVNLNSEKANQNYWHHIIYSFVCLYLKFVVQIKKCFHIITIKQIHYGLIFIIPFKKYKEPLNSNELKLTLKEKIRKKYYEIQLTKCIPKIKKLMRKYKINTLILSDTLRENEIFINEFQKNRKIEKEVKILEDKDIMPYLIQEIIMYILQKHGKTTEMEDLYILVNQDNSKYREHIEYLTKFFKTINLVTPCVKSYQKFANQLQEKLSEVITVTNNKKKSLRKAKWIVNFDMLPEDIKKYTIYRTANIIYAEKDNIYKGSGFEGLHICRAGIDVSDELKDFFISQNLLSQCSLTVLYESTIFNQKNVESIHKRMKSDKVKIEKLYGIRGELTEKEYEQC